MDDTAESPTRELTSHRVNGLNESLRIEVLDQPGQGGACHEYRVTAITTAGVDVTSCDIHFQNGPVKEAGMALGKVQEAMMWLHKRTRDRMARGVEGLNKA